jgi:glycosyltransferase involved in cell wall biosynthesis
MHLPNENVPEAGQKICYQHLKKLAKESHVHLISCVNSKELAYLKKDDFAFCASAKFVKVTRWTRLFNLITNFWLPYQVAVRRSPAISAHVAKLASDGASAIHIEYEHGAFVLNDVSGLTERTVVFHDVISQSADRRAELARGLLKRLVYGVQAKLAGSWERRLLPKVDRAVVLSEKDRRLLVALGFTSSIVVDYPVVSDAFASVRRDRYERHTMLFWGAMNRRENEDAVLWFVSNILPRVTEVIPGAVLLVVGANPSERVKALGNEHVVVTGFVEDPIPYFERAAVAVAPLRFGAGIKLKVLEALAAGLCVIGTEVAAEGVRDDARLFVADSESHFASIVIERLGSPVS